MPDNIDKAPGYDERTGWSALAKSYRRGEIHPPHYHIKGQLLFATQRVMLVETGDRPRVVPPQRALWLPPVQE